MALSANECRADFGGCDNFNDHSIDASRWSGPVVASGVGFLSETNQRLEFTTTGGNDACFLRWALNTGSYTQDWELKVDVNIGMPVFNTASPQPAVHLNLVVAPGTNVGPNNIFSIEFGKEDRSYLHCEVVSGDGQVVLTQTNTTAANPTNLSLRIAFDSAQKTLSAYVDEDAANCSHFWKPMGSTVVPAVWGMTSNQFTAVLLGVSRNLAIASTNNVFFDNFRAASGPVPRLQIARQDNDVSMSWPTNAADFQLESTATVAASICWTIVTNVVTTVGTNFIVTELISDQARFFRLNRIYGCQ